VSKQTLALNQALDATQGKQAINQALNNTGTQA